ncbi:hypothetical protein ACTWP5_30400 [Streptomyces sp. 4N509B]|uniref:hypothetical protein n=1 Tax=Streptomyces sp. 4N509B TaxID=3457413 RepID=UPI003FD6967D
MLTTTPDTPNEHEHQDHEHENEPHHGARLDPETETSYQHLIRGAMDSVIQYCRNTVRENSHRGFWTPTENDETPLTHADLIHQARTGILRDLRMVLDCAETVATEIERDRQRHDQRQQPTQPGE